MCGLHAEVSHPSDHARKAAASVLEAVGRTPEVEGDRWPLAVTEIATIIDRLAVSPAVEEALARMNPPDDYGLWDEWRHSLPLHGSPTPEATFAAGRAAQKARADKLAEALRRLGNRRMWRELNGELVWRGDDGNEIETEDPRDIASAALKAHGKGGVDA